MNHMEGDGVELMPAFCWSPRYRIRESDGSLRDSTPRPDSYAAVHISSFCWLQCVYFFFLCRVSDACSTWEAPLASSVLIGVFANSQCLRCRLIFFTCRDKWVHFILIFLWYVHFAFSQEMHTQARLMIGALQGQLHSECRNQATLSSPN